MPGTWTKYNKLRFQPNTNKLSDDEHNQLLDDLKTNSPKFTKDGKVDFFNYLVWLTGYKKSLENNNPNSDEYILRKNMLVKLIEANKKKIKFIADERKILDLKDTELLNHENYSIVLNFYTKYKDEFMVWAKENEAFFNNLADRYELFYKHKGN